ncbi:VWA domain-containing protein [bacterium]|nr:VWA domain-containing protein [bacterium]
MRFESPQILIVIPVAAVGLLLFYLFVQRRKSRLLRRFGDWEVVSKLTRGVSRARQNGKFILLTLGVMLVLFSIARPQFGALERPMRRRGVEVVVAVDCSNSMLGQDIQPSRLARAKDQLRGLIHRLRGDNIAIVAFGGVPIIQCPMTSDYNMVLNLLDSISVNSVPVQGTCIGDAIRKSLQAFRLAGSGHKVLVLLTDGEDHESKPIEAAKEAAEQGVRIYAIGIGSTDGVPIPMPGGGYLESDGSKVSTRLDFDTLRRIALETGGKAILANPSGEVELDAIHEDIAVLKNAELESTRQVQHEERFQYFLLPAIALLMLEILLGERRRERKAKQEAQA